jgi:hypothetical protein
MVKVLRWAALVAFLSLPVIVFLGRPVDQGCSPPVHNPCDPYHVSPTWMVPVFITALAIALVLSLIVVGLAVYQRSGRTQTQSN